jgi:predicted ATP-grasp superfamily ATP-dependent carboligase
MQPKVLVTDSSERSGLAVIRSLGKKDIFVIAADSTNSNAGILSRYAKAKVLYPSPQKSKQRFVDSLLKFVKTQKLDILIPVTDFTLIPILERKDEFEKYVKVATPHPDVAYLALDKSRTYKIAEDNSIPYPKTYAIQNPGDLARLSKEIHYPVVIKPRMKIFWSKDKAVMLKVTARNYAFNPYDLVNKYENLISSSNLSFPDCFFLAQEYAPGRGYGVEILMHDSQAKAVFAHKRIREYPLKGGASTYRMSIYNNTMLSLAVKLLKAMKWEGVAMVEFKFDSLNQATNLIEVNGRFWGSLALSINAGVDFPYLLYKSIMNEEFDTPNYNEGLTQRWLLPGDLLWLYSSIVDQKRYLSSIKEFVASFTSPDDIFSFDDPAPIVGEIRTALSSVKAVAEGKSNVFGETLNVTER